MAIENRILFYSAFGTIAISLLFAATLLYVEITSGGADWTVWMLSVMLAILGLLSSIVVYYSLKKPKRWPFRYAMTALLWTVVITIISMSGWPFMILAVGFTASFCLLLLLGTTIMSLSAYLSRESLEMN